MVTRNPLITSPIVTEKIGFYLSGNYYMSVIVGEKTTRICFPICSQNSLFCFELTNLIDRNEIAGKTWFGYETDSKIIMPPDRPGFFIKKEGEPFTGNPGATSRIFWDMPHETDIMRTQWSDVPVVYSNLGSSYPAIAFLGRDGGYYVAIGDTPDRAVLSCIHLARTGWQKLEEESLAFASRVVHRDDPIIFSNVMLSIFYSNSRCVDTDGDCIMASKSPEYYVASGFWSRDFVLWTLPLLETVDRERAKQLVDLMLTRYWKNKGIHALYLDGRVLYDGFELDQLTAYLIAIYKALEWEIRTESEAGQLVNEILEVLEKWKAPDLCIFGTELDSSDDPVINRYVTYNNVLLWHSLDRLSSIMKDSIHSKPLWNLAGCLKKSIMENMIDPQSGAFCYSTDLKGSYEMYDNPTGSLLLLPYLGFVHSESQVMKKTVSLIMSEKNRWIIHGKFSGLSNRHVPHPWIHHFASLLLYGDPRGLMLRNAPLDSGLACETIDVNTGVCLTGIHFPGASGFMSYAMTRKPFVSGIRNGKDQ